MSKHNKKDAYGIPNVNFTLNIEDKGMRHKFKQQRLERGFDNTEVWNLDHTMAQFIAPRLKVFREDTHGCPGNFCEDGETFEESMRSLSQMLQNKIYK